MLERGDQFLAPRRIASFVGRFAAALPLEADEIGEQSLAAADEPLALGGARRLVLGRRRSATRCPGCSGRVAAQAPAITITRARPSATRRGIWF